MSLTITTTLKDHIYQFVDEDKNLCLGMLRRLDISVDSNPPPLISNDFNIAVETVNCGSKLWT